MEKIPRKLRKKLPTNSYMARKLDNLVRPVSKLLYGNICQTCSIRQCDTKRNQLHWSHYITRRYYILRWDIRNCIPQCASCHQRYGDGFNSNMISAINRIWGKTKNGLDMTDYLEDLALAHPSIKGTMWNDYAFRNTLTVKYRCLQGYLEDGLTVTKEQFNLMKKNGYPNIKEMHLHLPEFQNMEENK